MTQRRNDTVHGVRRRRTSPDALQGRHLTSSGADGTGATRAQSCGGNCCSLLSTSNAAVIVGLPSLLAAACVCGGVDDFLITLRHTCDLLRCRDSRRAEVLRKEPQLSRLPRHT